MEVCTVDNGVVSTPQPMAESSPLSVVCQVKGCWHKTKPIDSGVVYSCSRATRAEGSR